MSINAVSHITSIDGSDFLSSRAAAELYKPIADKARGITNLTQDDDTATITSANGEIYCLDNPSGTISITPTSGSFYLLLNGPDDLTIAGVSWEDNHSPFLHPSRAYLIYCRYTGGRWVAELLDDTLIEESNFTSSQVSSFASIVGSATDSALIFDSSMSGTTIALSANLTIPDGAVLDASRVPGGVTLNCGTYTITTAGKAELRGLKIKGSASSSSTQVTFSNSGTLYFVDCCFDGTTAKKDIVYTTGKVYMKGCILKSCVTTSTSGGIVHSDTVGSLVITDCLFDSCKGAQTVIFSSGTNADYIARSKFIKCLATSTSSALGSRVAVRSKSGTLELVNCFITGSAQSSSGSLVNYAVCTYSDTTSAHIVNIRNCTITGNTGGIANGAGTINLYNSIVCDNGTSNIYGTVNNAGAKSILTTGSINTETYYPEGSALGGGDLSYIDSGIFSKDLAGYKRTIDTIDLGCYESSMMESNSVPKNSTIAGLFYDPDCIQKIVYKDITDVGASAAPCSGTVFYNLSSSTTTIQFDMPDVGSSVRNNDIVEINAIVKTSVATTPYFTDISFLDTEPTSLSAGYTYFFKFTNIPDGGLGRRWIGQLIGSVAN